MSSLLVGGIYIERHGLTCLLGNADISEPPYPKIRYEHVDRFEWDPSSPEQAIDTLKSLSIDLADKYPTMDYLGVSSFGPFVNLTPNARGYGQIHEKVAAPPLKGVNLFDIFQRPFHYIKSSTKIRLFTDASALATGEAMTRDLTPDQMLVSLLITEGIGGATVVGRQIQRSALHPEFGLLPVRFQDNDPLYPEKGTRLYSRGISKMADNRAMRERYANIHKGDDIVGEVTDEQIFEHTDSDLWGPRAYYLAQACLIVTATQAPHQILLTTDFGRADALIRDTRSHFEDFWYSLGNDKNPTFTYPELKNLETFISGLSGYPDKSLEGLELNIPLVGAAGMCMQAALCYQNDNKILKWRSA